VTDLSRTPSHESLRQRLDQIAAGSEVPQHPALVAALRAHDAHVVEIAQDDDVAQLSLDKYNCFEYAFGLAGSQSVIQIASVLASVYPGADFVSFLITNYLFEVPADRALDNTVVIYFDGQTITHAGRMVSSGVQSKWGTGHLWKHGLFEIPTRYGDHVRFYRPIPKLVVEQAFVAYAKAREGVTLIDSLLGK